MLRAIEAESLGTIILEERISSTLIANSSEWSMAGIDNGFVRQHHELVINALHQAFMAHSGKVGPANAKIE